jgi:type IV pilus assembly protein PilB
MSAKLGEILVRENLISSQQLREVLEYQRTNGGRLGSNLVNLGIISDDVITAVLSRQYGVPSINLDLFQIEPETIRLISQEVALKYSVLPISKVGATLTLAMADPTNVFAMDDIKFMTSLSVEPVIASEASLITAIGKYYSASNQIDIFELFVRCNASAAQNARRAHFPSQNHVETRHFRKTATAGRAHQSQSKN